MENYYLGLPQLLWDDLLYDAETKLEEELFSSAHIVGLYPYGPRLYGIESESPGLLCLYVDSSIDRLLNPFIREKFSEPMKVVAKTDGSFIYYMDLWSWISSLNNKVDFVHLAPCFGEVCHEDSSIRELMDLANSLVCANIIRRNPEWTTERNKYDALLGLRTAALFVKEEIFCPCINPEWGEVGAFKLIPNHIRVLDKKLITTGNLDSKESKEYRDYLDSTIIGLQEYKKEFSGIREKLAAETIKFYRFQL